jgi:hypothetical protein
MIKKLKQLLNALMILLATTSAQAELLPGYQSYNGVTNDVGPGLAAVIEHDVTQAACEQYQSALDQYLVDNDAALGQLAGSKENLTTMSEQERYIVDNFVDRYDRDTVLKCGKYLYFYGHFDTTGAPKIIVNWVLRYFDDFFGPGMSNFGMYEDPNPVATIPAPKSNPGIGTRQLPVGMASSSGDFADGIPAYSFTCGACHFKKMEDGNYAVGIGNTEYDYARMTAAQGQLPLSFALNLPGEEFSPDGLLATVERAVSDAKEKYDAPGQDNIMAAFLELNEVITSGSEPEDLSSIQSTKEEQDRNWNTWAGVMDFMVRPMQDDGVHTLTRMMNTNAIPTDKNILKQYGFSQHAGVSWNGGGYSLIQFIRGFITITPSDQAAPESRDEYNYWVNEYRYMPLVRYLETLDEPHLPIDRTFDTAAATRGEAIFDANCTSCHNGPGGETSRAYDHAEVNVESAHADIMNPYWDPAAFGGKGGWENSVVAIAERFPAGTSGELTRQVKAPRFISMWDNKRLLHNGSVGGLAELLTCASDRTSYATVIPEVDRVPTQEEHFAENPMFSNQGHEFGCHFSEQDKADLITFIETFKTHRDVGNTYNGQFDAACAGKSDGKSRQTNLTVSGGNRMTLQIKYFADDACQVFDTSIVNNPNSILSWGVKVGGSFINSRGFESHRVTYAMPDGAEVGGVIAIENGQLASAEEGDPVPRGLYVRAKTDYPGLNGIWLDNVCTDKNTRTVAVIQDGYRVDKLVTYSGANCSGRVASKENVGAWTFADPKWLGAANQLQGNAKYNMRLKMKSLDGGGWSTQFVNRWGDNLSTALNNSRPARNNGSGVHYTRIY